MRRAEANKTLMLYFTIMKRFGLAGLLPLVSFFVILGGTVYAQYSSSNYEVYEYNFGSGGDNGQSSANYKAQTSVGNLGVGNYSSSNYQAYPGSITPQYPYLEFIVNASNTDVGVLSVSSPTTTTGTFSVKTYLASGYQVTTTANPPTYSGYQLSNLSSPTLPSAGTEQFGINLVANNSCGHGLPASLGADPVQVPSSAYSFGTAAANYNTACYFKYVKNDVIANSSKSSGETDYTISFMYDISNLTPSGTYSFNDTLVATSTF